MNCSDSIDSTVQSVHKNVGSLCSVHNITRQEFCSSPQKVNDVIGCLFTLLLLFFEIIFSRQNPFFKFNNLTLALALNNVEYQVPTTKCNALSVT